MGKSNRDWLGSLSGEQKAEYMYQYLVGGERMSEVDEAIAPFKERGCSTLHRYYGFGGINSGLYASGYKGKRVQREDFVAFVSLYPQGLPTEQVMTNGQKNTGDVFAVFLEERYQKEKAEQHQKQLELEKVAQAEKAAQAEREKVVQAEREKVAQAEREKANHLQQEQKSGATTTEGNYPSEAPKNGKGSILPMVVGAGILGYLAYLLLF